MSHRSHGAAARAPILTTVAVLLSTVLMGVSGRPALAKPAAQQTFPTLHRAVAASARYATSRGYRTGVAVIDTRTGSLTSARDDNSYSATESVVKVFIATRLLLSGQMRGATSEVAYRMITRSDDAAASALYGRAGGARIVPLLERTYRIKHVGTPPPTPGWWGGTRVTARGLAKLYHALRNDSRVWPWLSSAMHHATRYGSDGMYQFFGIPSATTRFAVKQGWGADNTSRKPAFNSTGYVNADRFAVIILTEGPRGSYGSPISGILTGQARTLMPDGQIPGRLPRGTVTKVIEKAASVRLAGWAFDEDKPAKSIRIAVYDDTQLVGRFRTNRASAKLNQRKGLTGDHRFAITVPATPGVHRYRLVAINVGPPGKNKKIGTAHATVTPVPTATTVDTCLGTPLPGQPVILTARVEASATGTVTFSAGSVPLGSAPVSQGSAFLATADLPVGTSTITAHYSGDDRIAPSDGTADIQVTAGADEPSLLICPGSVITGEAVTAIASFPKGAPDAPVSFFVDGQPWSTIPATAGSAILGGIQVPAGDHTITASSAGVAVAQAVHAGG